MGSRGAYAGQPHSFACAKCRRSDYRTTGKLRRQLSSGANYHGWPRHAYQYKCSDCGHVGWSRHPSVQNRYRNEHTQGLSWSHIKMLCAQGKRGTLRESGLAECEEAMRRDPEKYSVVKREADREVIEEMQMRSPPKT